MEPDFRELEITIVGLGLIGGSLAKALRKLAPRKLYAVDIDPDVLAAAEASGVIDKGFRQGAEPLSSSDLVIICLYPGLIEGFILENMDHFRTGAVITDTAGIKAKLLEHVQRSLRQDIDFVGGHPLAGKEGSGYVNASADIFSNANYILTPTAENKETSLRLVEKMIQALGCNPPVRMSAEEHDEIIALTSQLPHVIAAALVNSCPEERTALFIGGSFKDATRVAQMNVPLWNELFIENRDNAVKQIDIFMDNLRMIREVLHAGEADRLAEILIRVNEKKATY